MRLQRILWACSVFVACNGGGDVPSDAVTLDWAQGQVFHVAASYRVANVKNEEIATPLEGGEAPRFGEYWTDDVVWTYQVVETGVVPDPSDELYPYAETRDGVAPLAVVRAFVDPLLNGHTELLEADPVVYLVFREDRDRLAAVISFENVDGERVEKAWSSRELGRSWSLLSQSMLTAAPTYLAPFSARYVTEEKVLENGSRLATEVVQPGTVDAFFDDELGGGLVVSRYEEGQPWPTWTVSDNVDARLLDPGEVEALRGDLPWMDGDPEAFPFREALARSVDLDGALVLSEADVAEGWVEGIAREGYRPWAGSWWPQKQGALVFGYDDRDTLSDRVRDAIDPLKVTLDQLSKEIRELDDGPDKDAKRATYEAKQSELIDALVEFYNGVRNDLDGGKLTIGDGQLTHTDGWSYDLDELSPMDKMALKLHFDGKTSPNPWFLPAWELLNHYSPDGGSWWGHCNGWSGAAILANEAKQPIDVSIGSEIVQFTTADIKGLLTETHYSTVSSFYGQRYYKEGDDLSDLSPKAFHQLVMFYIRDGEVPMVFDTDAGDQVWNFPAYGFDMVLTETTEGGGGDLVNVNTADVDELDTLPGIGPSLAGRIVDYRLANGPFQSIDDLDDVSGIGPSTVNKVRAFATVSAVERTFDVLVDLRFATDAVDEAHVDSGEPEGFVESYAYTLVTDADLNVVGGEWAVEDEHPDFAWVPYNNPLWTRGGSENYYLTFGDLIGAIGEGFSRE